MEPENLPFKDKKWVVKKIEMKGAKGYRGKVNREQKAIMNEPHNKKNLCIFC